MATPSAEFSIMPLEIERKFLVKNENWRDQVKDPPRHIRQAYLASPAVPFSSGDPHVASDRASRPTSAPWAIPGWSPHEPLGALDQGSVNEEVRVRIERVGPFARASLTVKSVGGLVREETELPIDPSTAERLFSIAPSPLLEKIRFEIPLASGHTVEVDVYQGAFAGLVIAEVELAHATELLDLPDFLGTEVTDDPAYKNVNLARCGHPGVPLLSPGFRTAPSKPEAHAPSVNDFAGARPRC